MGCCANDDDDDDDDNDDDAVVGFEEQCNKLYIHVTVHRKRFLFK
jgi:hypothetical protein